MKTRKQVESNMHFLQRFFSIFDTVHLSDADWIIFLLNELELFPETYPIFEKNNFYNVIGSPHIKYKNQFWRHSDVLQVLRRFDADAVRSWPSHHQLQKAAQRRSGIHSEAI